MSNDLVNIGAHDIFITSADSGKSDNWEYRYGQLIDQLKWADQAKYTAVKLNPFYAVVNATAFILERGNFRGYEHFASVFFDPVSRHYVGLKVHKERTRTHIDKGAYVTDWYVEFTGRNTNIYETLYRAAFGILFMSVAPSGRSFVRYSEQNTHNIRGDNHADQKAQISSS